MTNPGGGRPSAGDGKEREPVPSYPLLVRVGGRWLCRHELAALMSAEHVQLRP
jgi:hypothetical protein